MRNLIVLLLAFCMGTLAATASADEPTRIKVIAFDCFGTVFDFSSTPKDEIRDYIRQVRRPEWSPLDLPDSWLDLPAFPDSAEGIERLREDYIVVTCANGPLGMLAQMAKRNGIEFDAIIPLEMIPAYKPDMRTYQRIADVFGVDPSEVLMVSGNEGSPDLTVPKAIGMQTQRIRGDASTPQTITELADLLEDNRKAFQ